MADRPQALRLGAHWFTVDSTPETGLLLHDEGNSGDSRPDRLLIRLDAQRPESAVAETFLHEVLHCVWSMTSLGAEKDLDEQEEAVVTALAPWLLELIQRNPDLMAYLASPDD